MRQEQLSIIMLHKGCLVVFSFTNMFLKDSDSKLIVGLEVRRFEEEPGFPIIGNPG